MDLCLAAKWRPGPRVPMQWWYQGCVDLEGMWTVAQDAEQTYGEEETDGTETVTEN